MKVTEEDLRRLFTESPAGRPDRRDRCPSPEVLAEAASGSFGAMPREALADHLVACADCAEEYRLRGAADAAGEEAPGPRRRPRLVPLRPGWAWAAAAAVLLAVVAVPLLRTPGTGPANVRTSHALEIRSVVPEDQALPRAQCVLRWTAGPPGTRYAVTVATADLTTLHTASGLGEPALKVPAEKLSAVASGGRVLWTVEAELPDGRRVRSPAFAARLE
jgi:hypothetical protein